MTSKARKAGAAPARRIGRVRLGWSGRMALEESAGDAPGVEDRRGGQDKRRGDQGLGEAEEGALGVGRVERGAASRVAGPPGVDQVESRVVPDLADDDPGRGGAQSGAD